MNPPHHSPPADAPAGPGAETLGVHHWISRTAALHPDAPALFFGEEIWTHHRLESLSNRIAAFLIDRGVGPGDLVAIGLPRTPLMVAALVATLKTGAAYVPVDPAFPPGRIAFILADVSAKILLTDSTLSAPSPDTPAIFLDRHLDEISALPDSSPVVPADPSSPVYILHTSGSTGAPKGVVIPHRACLNLLRSFARTPGFSPSDKLLAVTTLSFDISFLELFLPLVTGGSLVLATREQAVDGPALRRLLESSAATVMQATPATWKMLLETGWQGSPRLKILCGGETLPPTLAAALLPRCGELWNVYGPTETTVWSTLDRVTGPAITIGRPIDATTVHLLDADLRPVPPGHTGELHIGGAGLAIGYHRRPDLTAEKFIDHPRFGRLYRTGDLARLLPDGRLECLGRIDHQIKLRGHRIELGEIEHALLTLPFVRDAAARVHEPPDGEKILAAWLVAENPPPPADIRAALAALLPAYMLPGIFVFLEKLPLTPNGKVDRNALPFPAAGDALPSSAPPRDAVEERLAAIFRDLLHHPAIGIHDDFFHLGGHSLAAMRAVNRINREFGINLPLARFFAAPDIASLAVEIPATAAASLPPVAPLPNAEILLSENQQGLWLIENTLPGLAAYNLTQGWRITGPLDRQRLETAIARIVERHDILRLVLPPSGPALSPHAPPLAFLDLSLHPAASREEELDRLSRQIASRPFDLAHGPLFHATLCRLHDTDHALLLAFHHLISDQWSLGLFIAEIASHYLSPGDPPSRPPLQFNDYAHWQNFHFPAGRLQTARDYWRRQLENAPFLDLPADRARPAVSSFAGAEFPFALPPDLAARLHAFHRQHGGTPFSILLTLFALLVSRWSDRTEFLIGTPAANRPSADLEPLIGYFVNMVPLRMSLAPGAAFTQAVLQTSETVIGALDHQDLPFAEITRLLNPPRSANRHPLFQIVFILHEANDPPALGDLPIRPFHPHSGTSKFDLTLRITRTGDAFHAAIEYDTALFSEPAIRLLARGFTALLHSAFDQPDTSLDAIAAPLREIPPEWSGLPTPYPRDASLGALFTATARSSPDAPAISDESRTWTYFRLLHAALGVASHLVRHGVRPGDFIAIAGASSCERIASLLGTILAGAAYVPIDPTLPADRLALVLSHSDAKFILGDEPAKSRLAPHGIAFIDHASAIHADPIDDPPLIPADAPACLMYTSGTTGAPKAAVIPHRAIVRLVRGANYLDFTAPATFLQAAPLAFDASTFEIWGALLNGHPLVLAPPDPTLEQLARTIRDRGVTTLWLTSGLFQLMAERHPDAFAGVKHLLTGGDVVSPAHARLVLDAAPSLHLINGYGPTENTTFTTCRTLTRDDLLRPTLPIGMPVSNTTVHLLDEDLRPVPPGAPGILHAGGDGLAIGYHREPAHTAAAFIDHPDFGRLYRTGDLCRWLPDGAIEFIGRDDGMLKIRGFRIETGEIETALLAHPSVAAAKVAARGSDAATKRLVAWVRPARPGDLDPRQLAAFLARTLPPYMVPSGFVEVGDFPLGPTGKIDVRALPDPDPLPAPSLTPPATAAEQRLAAIWRDLLGAPTIGRESNWFDLGGHSLLALAMFSRIHREMGRLAPLSALLEHPTLASLAAFLGEPPPDAPGSDPSPKGNLVTLSKTTGRPPLFCIHGGDGGILFYRDLPAHLPPDLPVHAIESLVLAGSGPIPAASIAETAASYLRLILHIAPTGPYRLAGYSFGGVVAHEIACQLADLGHEVDFLGLFDTHNLAAPHRPFTLAQRLREFWESTRPLPLPQRLARLAARTADGIATHLANRRDLLAAVCLPPGPPHGHRRKVQLREENRRAMKSHRPRVFPGRVTLFLALVPDDKIDWPADHGWTSAAAGLDIVHVPGKHLTLFDPPNIASLAGHLARKIPSSATRP